MYQQAGPQGGQGFDPGAQGGAPPGGPGSRWGRCSYRIPPVAFDSLVSVFKGTHCCENIRKICQIASNHPQNRGNQSKAAKSQHLVVIVA